NRLRVNVQLVDAETGAHLWADRFDKPEADLFDMQDEIVSRLANTLDDQLTEHEARRSARSPHPNSMDLYFQGKALLNKGWTLEHVKQAGSIFQRALALDPQNIEAMVGKAEAEYRFANSFMSDDQRALRAATEVTVAKLLSVAPTH